MEPSSIIQTRRAPLASELLLSAGRSRVYAPEAVGYCQISVPYMANTILRHFHGDDVSVANRIVSLNPTEKVSSDSLVAREGLTSAFSRFHRMVGEKIKVAGDSNEPLEMEYWGVGVVVEGESMNLIALSMESRFFLVEVFKIRLL